MALRFRAKMKQGDTILINGATGFTGKIAVQLARHYGAKKIIATGRNEQSLQSLLGLGADHIISLKQGDDSLAQEIKSLHGISPIDIVIDYLWGHSAEIILNALKGDGGFSHQTRYVTVGAMSGDKIELSSSILRSSDLQISGSGLGSWASGEVRALINDILPEMFQLAAAGKLKIETIDVNIENIENIWDMHVGDGKRLVVTI
jgi:NADPH:quinone reductase-like Zn-dependent oxidoreductase